MKVYACLSYYGNRSLTKSFKKAKSVKEVKGILLRNIAKHKKKKKHPWKRLNKWYLVPYGYILHQAKRIHTLSEAKSVARNYERQGIDVAVLELAAFHPSEFSGYVLVKTKHLSYAYKTAQEGFNASIRTKNRTKHLLKGIGYYNPFAAVLSARTMMPKRVEAEW